MKPGEITVGVVWAFSAVKVAGYSWRAFFGSYDQFPAVGGNAPGSGDQGTTNAWTPSGFIENTITAITNPGEFFSGLGTAFSNALSGAGSALAGGFSTPGGS